MTEAPERIWINDKWEAYLRPTFNGDKTGYIRADLVDPAAIREAALREAAELFGDSVTGRAVARCILALIDKKEG